MTRRPWTPPATTPLANGVADRLDILAPDDFPDPTVDCVLANILAGPLIALAPRLIGMLRPGGRSGRSPACSPSRSMPVRAAYAERIALEPPRTPRGLGA